MRTTVLTSADGSPHVALVEKLEQLRTRIKSYANVVVAFSGGADSALVAYLANECLGARSLAATAVSPSLPADELAHCASLASSWGMEFVGVQTNEMDNPAYQANDGDRCYWCKAELMDVVAPIAAKRDNATVLLGVNVDDLGEHRPGQRAARERGASFPLVDAGCTKDDVRAISRLLGLSTWDRPAAACLASRIPYGVPVTLARLSRVERAEAALRTLGFDGFRVRHYDGTARLEVPLADLERVVACRTEVVAAVKRAGYDYVTLDLEGFRSGNLNAALGADQDAP